MDFLEVMEIEALVNEEPQQRVQRRRRVRIRTSEVFMEEMLDLEFKRTFRFSKENVRRIAEILGSV